MFNCTKEQEDKARKIVGNIIFLGLCGIILFFFVLVLYHAFFETMVFLGIGAVVIFISVVISWTLGEFSICNEEEDKDV